jgi:tRNA A-37 threonylcarbamoyl transferase component Bud32
MTPERWHRIDEVLQAALDQVPADRTEFLETECSGDAELLRETTSLAKAYDKAGDFLEQPALAKDAKLIAGEGDLLNGQEIDRYKILRRIGGGGMGDIYLAQDTRLERLVALKILRAYLLSDDERVRRFQIEARAASALNHTNILTIYDVGEFENNLYIAAEYVEGRTIRDLISEGNLTLGEVADLAIQMLAGLSAAHAAGIIHRDIKPENIIQRSDGVVKILDFGIAKLLEPSSNTSINRTTTDTGIMMGTVGYMSPEQMRGLLVDERTDVWSCGVVLYEMLTHRQPLRGATHADTLVAMLEREPEPLFGDQRLTDRVLSRLQAIVNQALSKDPIHRYQSAAEMGADLDEVRNELENGPPLGDVRSGTLVGELLDIAALARAKSYRRQWLFVAAAFVLVVFFAGALLIKRPSPNQQLNPSTTEAAKKLYLQMNETERLAFVAAQEQRISAMMGDRPVKLSDEALLAIKQHVDRYAARSEGLNKPGQDSLQTSYTRAPPHIPTIARAFHERKIPIVIGIYLAMVESDYRPCYENQIGARGLFQFLPPTAARYGVKYSEMCDVEKVAPAAAHYVADRMAELGDDSQSMTLVLLSYNRGDEAVRDALRQLRETDANYERNFWTLFANRQKLDAGFQRESSGYVPDFFAAAIIGENPGTFDLHLPPLSTLSVPSPSGDRATGRP